MLKQANEHAASLTGQMLVTAQNNWAHIEASRTAEAARNAEKALKDEYQDNKDSITFITAAITEMET